MENDLKNKNQNNNQNNELTLNSSYDKNKELLIKLLKEKLDTKLCKLEKRHKNQISIMKLTADSVKNITNWSINAYKQIKEKLRKDKEKQNLQSKQSKSKKRDPMSITGKTSFLKTKTPIRMKNPKSLTIEDPKIDATNRTTKNKSLIGSKTVKTMGNRTKSFSFLTKDKKKSIIITKKSSNNLNVVGNNYLQRPSVISNKSNKSNKTNLTSKTPKSRKSIVKVSNKNVTPVRKKTPFKKRNNASERGDSVHSTNNIKNLSRNQSKQNTTLSEINIKKNEQNKTMQELNINKMESALQKSDLLDNNDPLLVAPITDSDFYLNGKLSATNSEITDVGKIQAFTFNINMEKNIDDKLYSKISDYLSLNDLIQFRNISKYFYKLFNIYMINKLHNNKELFIKKMNNFDKNNIPPKLTFKDFVLSKGCIKAIKLLNQPTLNHIFNEESAPNDDRLVIYRIFFQLINHPYKNIPKNNKEEFWTKCQNYFSNEINGKTGELLQKIIDEKMINLEGDNLYKIYKLTENNLNKIYPNYYSKICGTTGLFVFFIKDILDFVGISNDEKIQSKAYWTYEKIIESLDNKINHIKQFEKI